MPEQGVQAVEVYWVTPRDLAIVVLIQVLLVVLAVAWTVWAMWPGRWARRDGAARSEGGSGGAGLRRGRRPHRTGTIHAPGVHVPADETVVIDTGGVSR